MSSLHSRTDPNGYAVYLLNINRHHVNSDNHNNARESNSKSSDSEQSNICLSLFDSNLEAEQEGLIRCHVQKTLSASDNISFENEGRCLEIKSSLDSKESFYCYYHHLVKETSLELQTTTKQEEESYVPKKTSYFICLVRQENDEIMNSFCSELSYFCNDLLSLLEPWEHENLQQKLKHWYDHSVLYIIRCIENFKEGLVILFQSSLLPSVEIECGDEKTKWDLERFIHACSLTNLSHSKPTNTESQETFVKDFHGKVVLKVHKNELTCDTKLDNLAYCQKWADELLLKDSVDPLRARNVLEMFRLKLVQDVNTMMRLLLKSENDFYSLFKAYQFYKLCGFGDILMWHVKQEAVLSSHKEVLSMINSLMTFFDIHSITA